MGKLVERRAGGVDSQKTEREALRTDGVVKRTWPAASTGGHLLAVECKPESTTKGALLAAQYRESVMKTAGLGECSQLCDIFQMERVCEEYVGGAFQMARDGAYSDLPDSLQDLLIAPLYRYLSTLTARGSKSARSGVRMEVEPTLRLIASAEAIVISIRVGPWDDDRAQAAALSLRYAWCVWIAYVASYWLTVEVPKRLAEQGVRRAHGAMGGKTPKQGFERSTARAEIIVSACEEAQKRLDPHEVAGTVANKLNVTPQWVRRVWNKHAATKAKQQASL